MKYTLIIFTLIVILFSVATPVFAQRATLYDAEIRLGDEWFSGGNGISNTTSGKGKTGSSSGGGQGSGSGIAGNQLPETGLRNMLAVGSIALLLLLFIVLITRQTLTIYDEQKKLREKKAHIQNAPKNTSKHEEVETEEANSTIPTNLPT